MTEQELRDLYNSTETQAKPVEYQEKPEEKQNFLPSDFDANAGTVDENGKPIVTETATSQDNTTTNNEVVTPQAKPKENTIPNNEEVVTPSVKTLDDVYKTIDYIEQTRYKTQQAEQERQAKIKQEEDAKKKAEEEKNRPFESSLKNFNYAGKEEYTPEEQARMKEIESIYQNDLDDYMRLKMRSYENKLVEMMKFIEKNQNEGLTKSINQYHNDNNTRISSIDAYVKQQQEKEDRRVFEENAKLVKERHADFEDANLRNDLTKWIYQEQTDPIDQQRLILLSQSAQAKHVNELLDKYKEARGIVVAPVTTQATNTAKPQTQNTSNAQQQEEARRKAQEEKDKIAKGLQQNNSTRASQPDTSGKKTLDELYKSMNI